MSSAYPSDSPASRTWWSLGSKHSSQHDLQHQLHHKPSRYSGLNSIAVALGFKSKKHPVLAIQDPGYTPSRSAMPLIVDKTYKRPPSKSVSSMQSPVDSLGPRTPQDSRDNRQSLLTFSANDPFAVPCTISSAPQSPSVPNRFAVFSNSSNPDVISKNTEPILNRVSYASSSSQSNTHGNDLSPLVPIIPNSIKNPIPKKQSLMSGDQLLESPWETLTSANKLNAGPFTLDRNRSSHPAAGRPSIRARDITDSGKRPESATLNLPSSPSSHTPTRSRTIIRQPSFSRTLSPPSAPPKQQLPPPPSVKDHRVKGGEVELAASLSADSASSSSLSFASSDSSQKDILFNQHYSPQEREKVPLESPISTRAGTGSVLDTSDRGRFSPPSHTLKKAISHQSLRRRPIPTTSSVPLPLPEPPAPSKAPHKQRSFHHPKFSLSPVSPTRSSTSSGLQPSTPIIDSQTSAEQRRGSPGGFSLPVRKRLFSAGSSSRRPSTSPSIVLVPEDDSRSVFSVRSVPDHGIGTGTAVIRPLGQPLSPNPNSSFWDEPSLPDHMPSSPRTVTHEYTPRQIMSPAEMAKLEASVDDIKASNTSNREGFSLPHTYTTASMMSHRDTGTSVAEAVVTSIHSVSDNPVTKRSTSTVRQGLSTLRLGERPSTSQVSMATPAVSERSSSVSSPRSPSMTSLPPPPRRVRPRATFVEDDSDPPSLPPPPGRRSVPPKISVEKILHRRSIMRKPSFLEIDDDSDKDTDNESLNEPPSGSFLDLARESFDTTSE